VRGCTIESRFRDDVKSSVLHTKRVATSVEQAAGVATVIDSFSRATA